MRILAVCTGNTCRSPMFAALLTHELARRGRTAIEVESAGTGAGTGDAASPEAAAAMARRGLDLADHASRNVRSLDLASYDRIWAMTSAHVAALRSLGVPAVRLAVIAAERGGVPDPFGGGMAEYEACALVLEDAARKIAETLSRPA